MYHNYRLNGPRKGEYIYRTRNPNKAVNSCYEELCKRLDSEDGYVPINKFSMMDITDKTITYFKQSGGTIKKIKEKKVTNKKTNQSKLIDIEVPNHLKETVSYPLTGDKIHDKPNYQKEIDGYKKEIKEYKREISVLKKQLNNKPMTDISLDSDKVTGLGTSTNASTDGFEALYELDNIKIGKKKSDESDLCCIM